MKPKGEELEKVGLYCEGEKEGRVIRQEVAWPQHNSKTRSARPKGVSQVKATCQRRPTSTRNGPALVTSLCSVPQWEQPMGSMAFT